MQVREPRTTAPHEPSRHAAMPIAGLGNYSQYKSVGETIGTVVGPPFMLTASDASAPGFGSSCISRSPSAPADCQGDDCFIYIDE